MTTIGASFGNPYPCGHLFCPRLYDHDCWCPAQAEELLGPEAKMHLARLKLKEKEHRLSNEEWQRFGGCDLSPAYWMWADLDGAQWRWHREHLVWLDALPRTASTLAAEALLSRVEVNETWRYDRIYSYLGWWVE